MNINMNSTIGFTKIDKIPKPIQKAKEISIIADKIRRNTQEYRISREYICSKGEWIEHFICPICFNLVENLKRCNSCDKKFCGECIRLFTNSSNSTLCPCCKAPWKPKNIDRALRDILNTLDIKCLFRNCGEVFTYNIIKTHMENCLLRLTPCPGSMCTYSGCGKDLEEHIYICPNIKWTCPYASYGCIYTETKAKLAIHQKFHCGFRPFECKLCSQLFNKYDISDHLFICENAQEECPDCGFSLRRRELDSHNCIHNIFRVLKINKRKFWNHIDEFRAFYLSLLVDVRY